MTTKRIIAGIAFTAMAILNNDVNGQGVPGQNGQGPSVHVVQPQVIQGAPQVIGQQVETRVIPQPVVAPQPPAPKLGFTGQFVYGVGRRVLGVNYGSPAQRAGLEHGDIIMRANGVQINSLADLQHALRIAAQFSSGTVNLYVKNIRGRHHLGNRYVNVTAHLFGQPVQSAVVAADPIVHN